jgi:predicted nuclease with TOPRIM domain
MFEIPVWAVGVGFIILCVAVGQVVARRLIPADQLRHVDRLRRLKGSKRDVAELFEELQGRLGEVDDLRKRLAEVEEMQRRLGEIEERLDFAERVLTKQREAERLAPPKG